MEKLAELLVGLLIVNAVANAVKPDNICTHQLRYWDTRSKERCILWVFGCSTEIVNVITIATVDLCCPGYKYYNDYYDYCQANCTPGCRYGYCLGSSSDPPCHCKKYTVKDNWECTPSVCKPACINGLCQGPNQCKCDTGYKQTNDSHVCARECLRNENCECIQDDNCICSHYEKTDQKCVPIVYNGTDNGNTTVPVQKCGEGYESDDEKCIARCSKGCLHGNCVEPEVCNCQVGYEKDSGDQNCVAKCKNDCGQGNCTDIDECTCWEGFKTDVDGSCTEQCGGDCVMGADTSGQSVIGVLLVIGALIVLLVVIVTVLICYWRKRHSKQHVNQGDGIPLDFSLGSQLPVIEEDEEDNYLYEKFEGSGETSTKLPDQARCDTGINEQVVPEEINYYSTINQQVVPEEINYYSTINQQVVPEEINYYSTINQQVVPEEVNYYCSINPQAEPEETNYYCSINSQAMPKVPEESNYYCSINSQAVPKVPEESNYYCSINPQAVPEVPVPGEINNITMNHQKVPEVSEEVAYYSTIKKMSK